MKSFIILTFSTLIILALIIFMKEPPLFIIDTPIDFSSHREDLTKAYIQEHYDLDVTHISIKPLMIVLHWTEEDNATKSFNIFKQEELEKHELQVKEAGQLNVSVHFMIDREGHIFRLMPETQMARHVIGLNYHAIGIENVGGSHKDGKAQANLTSQQLASNIRLVHYLTQKYPDIRYLIGHYEYQAFEKHPLWMEKDSSYRTQKDDPNPLFVEKVFKAQHNLNLRRAP